MTDDFTIPENEREVVRVFALDVDAAEAARFAAPPSKNGADWALKRALGADRLKPEHVELFPARDLSGVGLPGYLTEGLGIAEDSVAPDRQALEAEAGHIVIVHSAAFEGAAQTLDPQPPLRHLGTYRLAQADPPRPTVPQPSDETPEVTPTAPPPPGPPSRGVSAMVLLAILLAALAILVAVFLLRSQAY